MELAEIMDKMRALESELELATNELKGKLIDAVDRLPDGVRYLNDGSNGGPVIVLTQFSNPTGVIGVRNTTFPRHSNAPSSRL